MGLSYSFDCRTPKNKKAVTNWLTTHFEPWARVIGDKHSHARVAETPIDAPKKDTMTGFDVAGAPDSVELHYMNRVTQTLAKLAGQDRFFIDDTPVPVNQAIAVPSLVRHFFKSSLADIKGAVERLMNRWETAPPISSEGPTPERSISSGEDFGQHVAPPKAPKSCQSLSSPRSPWQSASDDSPPKGEIRGGL